MYKEFYKLTKNPFSFTADPAFTFETKNFNTGVNNVFYGIEKMEGLVVITGDIGTGKTTMCNYVISQLEKEEGNDYCILMCDPFFLDDKIENIFELFKRSDIQDIGWHELDNITRGTFRKVLQSLSRKGKKTVLIIDEADKLSLKMLQNISFLSNMEDNEKKLIQIVLTGEPSLTKKLTNEGLKQLNQRVTVRYKLKKLTSKEIEFYISHRLKVAGADGNVKFSPQAIKIIYKYTNGCQRLVNLLCDRALLRGSMDHSMLIDRGIVLLAMKSLKTEDRAPSFKFVYDLFPIFMAEAAVASLLFFGIWAYYDKAVTKYEASEQALPSAEIEDKNILDEKTTDKFFVTSAGYPANSPFVQKVEPARKALFIEQNDVYFQRNFIDDNSLLPNDQEFYEAENTEREDDQYVMVITYRARIRKNPSLDSETLSIAKYGSALRKIGESGNWTKVEVSQTDKSIKSDYGWIGNSIIEEADQWVPVDLEGDNP